MTSKHPLFHHYEHMEQTLLLIREQVKSRRFFNALRSLGLADTSGEVHLETMILYFMHIDKGSVEMVKLISGILERHSQDLNDDPRSVDKAAIEVYCELLEKTKGNEI